ncbi:MAG: hypothetical protein K2H29_02445 [Oscillospiraceae bacterium]|nr:hypothetical protein [Oscillospiraceae bacterium]
MKKRIVISILTAFALLLSAPATIHANAILGDVNHDSVLDVNDACAILEHCASIGEGNGGTLSDTARISADYGADGRINAKDAFKILVSLFKSGQSVPSGLNESDTMEEWKQAYAIQLDDLQSYKNRYELADINDDSIPELFIMLGDTSKIMVYTYQNGSCQQIYFPTESGAIDSCNMYICSEFDGFIVINYSNENPISSITDQKDTTTCYKIDTLYEIDENLQAIPKHELVRDYANDSYYFDDTPITREEYNNYPESVYWYSYFSDTTKRDLLNSYSTGKSQVYFIKNSIDFDRGWLTFKMDCNHMTEKSNITFHVVPHDSKHILENAMEYTDIEFYMKNLYEAVHDEGNAYCVLGEIPDGDYDLFLLADDGTELNSITFKVKENKSVYIY